ncbi:MAG: fibronectin type III domain-containing protein, partial [Candidatus Zixiibacteriota bacterium]
MDPAIYHISENYYAWEQSHNDDITGFLENYVDPFGETTKVNIAWAADNNGQSYSGLFTELSPTGVIGLKLLGCSNPNVGISYNWWISNGQGYPKDWGPWLKVNQQRWAQINPYSAGLLERFPDDAMGTPGGDISKYFLMSNGEIDYDQIFTEIVPDIDTSWIPCPTIVSYIYVQGFVIKFLYSFGPFNLAPGDTIFATVALIAGENFHTDPENRDINLPDHPYTYYSNLDFSDLVEKAILAQEFYDTGLDLIPPAPVEYLSASLVENGSVNVKWTATGDNGNLGTALYYDLRYSSTVVGTDTVFWWEHADTVENEPSPSPAGSIDSCQVSGLSPDIMYYFVIKAYDDVGFCSGFSNVAYSGLSGDVNLNGDVDVLD